MAPALQRVLMVRHGETEWSKSGRHTGTSDVALTEHGRRAALGLQPVVLRTPFALVLTSPMRRARETCELCGLGAVAKTDADLVEWRYGEYEGLTTAQIHARAPGWLIFRDGCPGGETPAAVSARVDRVIARVRAASGDVALFAHGHVLRVLAARWLGLPADAGQHFLLDTGTVNVLSYYRGVPSIKRWNAPGVGVAGEKQARLNDDARRRIDGRAVSP